MRWPWAGERAEQRAIAGYRVFVGLLFLQHGCQKVVGFPAHPRGTTWLLLSLYGIGGMIEVIGGTLCLLGMLFRPTMFVLAGEMAVAYWLFKAPAGFFPINNGGDAAVLFCAAFLLLLFTGPGRFSATIGDGTP